MAYEKQEVLNFTDKVYDFLLGLRDGLGADDLANLVAAITAAPAVMNEIREDFDAAGLHIVARLADKFGDSRVNPVVTDEQG